MKIARFIARPRLSAVDLLIVAAATECAKNGAWVAMVAVVVVGAIASVALSVWTGGEG